jgi:hypothetical protein
MDAIIEQVINKFFALDIENFIFIYTPPKVGSTTLVSSLRISLGRNFNVIHIHDNTMLSVLTGVNDVTIDDIIKFLSKQNKNVYVIDIYRTPIERKMSEFFEKIACYHFNNSEENISKYKIELIINRFNKLFPYLANGEHYFDKYKISSPVPFDFNKKYTVQEINNIKYIKLRLCDSQLWGSILSTIFNREIVIINDYITESKEIGDYYKKFKKEYKLPSNFLNLVKECKYLNFYYSEQERNNYLTKWSTNITENVTPYTDSEYNFYVNLYLENQYLNSMQTDHYIDNGCYCNLCANKRMQIFTKAKNGENITEKILHTELVNTNIQNKNIKIAELIKKKINVQNKNLNNIKHKTKQFGINISNV